METLVERIRSGLALRANTLANEPSLPASSCLSCVALVGTTAILPKSYQSIQIREVELTMPWR
jgi:hypothetical protein